MSPRIEEIERLLEQVPDDYLLLTTLGKEYLSAGEYERAVEILSKVIDINPDYSVAYRYLAEAFQKGGDREGAVKTYEDGIRDKAKPKCNTKYLWKSEGRGVLFEVRDNITLAEGSLPALVMISKQGKTP